MSLLEAAVQAASLHARIVMETRWQPLVVLHF